MSIKWGYRLRKTFFVQRSPDEAQRDYDRLMEEQFQLRYYGKLTLFEQNNMTAEDRAWWLKRTYKEAEEEAKKMKGNNHHTL